MQKLFYMFIVLSDIQCDAIRWEQFWRRCRLGQRDMAFMNKDSILDQIELTALTLITAMKIY